MAKSIASPPSIGPEYEALVEVLGAGLRAFDGDPRGAAVVRALVETRLLELLRRGDRAGVAGVLAEHTGERCTLAGLGVSVAGAWPGDRPTLTPRAQHLREAELGLEQARARRDAVGEEAKRLKIRKTNGVKPLASTRPW